MNSHLLSYKALYIWRLSLFSCFFALRALKRSFSTTLLGKTHEVLGLVLYRQGRISNPMERKWQKVGAEQSIQRSIFQSYGTKKEEGWYVEKYYSDLMNSFSAKVWKNGLGK